MIISVFIEKTNNKYYYVYPFCASVWQALFSIYIILLCTSISYAKPQTKDKSFEVVRLINSTLADYDPKIETKISNPDSAEGGSRKDPALSQCIPGLNFSISSSTKFDLHVMQCTNENFVQGIDSINRNNNEDIYKYWINKKGNISVQLYKVAEVNSRHHNFEWDEFIQKSAELKPGDKVTIKPGVYRDVRIDIPASVSGTKHNPIVIEGSNNVIIGGSSKIKVSGNHIEIRGFRFIQTDDMLLKIEGSFFRLVNSYFDACGNAEKPQSECVLISGGAKNAQVMFNTFTKSNSMTIKVRASEDGNVAQPTDCFIGFNSFSDIEAKSKNGQEVVQFAGPKGGASNVDLRCRVHGNVFSRTSGDKETISIKTSGINLRFNIFNDQNAAPNFRGAPGNVLGDNLLVRTRSVRLAGREQTISDNIIICPINGNGISISHGSTGYPASTSSVIKGNIFATQGLAINYITQGGAFEKYSSENKIDSNIFFIDPRKGQELSKKFQLKQIEQLATYSTASNNKFIAQELLCIR